MENIDKKELDKIDEIISNENYGVSDVIENLKKLNIRVSGEELRRMRSDLSKSRMARQITSYYKWLSFDLVGNKEFTSANIVNVVDKINDILTMEKTYVKGFGSPE